MPDRLTDELMAMRVAQDIQHRWVVNLGIGLPTRVANFVPPGRRVTFHAENGVLGYGPYPQPQDLDPYAVNAGGEYVSLVPGAAITDHAESFAVIRGGRVDVAVLGSYQVAENGDFANWAPGNGTLGSPGGAVDLAACAKQVWVLMGHTTRDNKPRILRRCVWPLTGQGSVKRIFTDLAVVDVEPDGLYVREIAPGWRLDDIQALTEPTLRVHREVHEMEFATPAAVPPLDKVYPNASAAVADIPDGAVLGSDGFGGPGGMPHCLIIALRERGARGLTIIGNTAGIASVSAFGTPPGYKAIDHSILVENDQVRKVIASFPVAGSPSRVNAFEKKFREGKVELEVCPQGTLAERLRAAGAGIAAFYTPTGAGTLIAQGKEERQINGRTHILERALHADFAFVRALKADTVGNLVYKGTSRNFNPMMAMAARVTIAEVDEVVPAGSIEPDEVHTPGIYVHRIVVRPKDYSPYVRA